MAQACKPSIWRWRHKESKANVGYISEHETSLSYLRPCLKTKEIPENGVFVLPLDLNGRKMMLTVKLK